LRNRLKKGLRNSLVLCVVAIALIGCRADQLLLAIDVKQLRSAAAGNEVVAEFKIIFSHPERLTTEQSAQVDEVWSALKQTIEISDFRRERVDDGLRVTIEGEIPIHTKESAQSAYFISLTESAQQPGFHQVALQTGQEFRALRNALSAVNYAIDLKVFHPTVFALTGQSERLLAPIQAQSTEQEFDFDGPLNGRVRLAEQNSDHGAGGRRPPGFLIRIQSP